MEILARNDNNVLDLHIAYKSRGLEHATEAIHLLLRKQGRHIMLHDRQQNLLQNLRFKVHITANGFKRNKPGLNLTSKMDIHLFLALRQ